MFKLPPLTKKVELPQFTQQVIETVDGTPNADYPLRILRAYRENCNCKWSDTGSPELETTNPLLYLMNQHQEERAKILDQAIDLLQGNAVRATHKDILMVYPGLNERFHGRVVETTDSYVVYVDENPLWEKLISALRKIARPIEFFRKEAKDRGVEWDGICDPNGNLAYEGKWFKDVAEFALKESNIAVDDKG